MPGSVAQCAQITSIARIPCSVVDQPVSQYDELAAEASSMQRGSNEADRNAYLTRAANAVILAADIMLYERTLGSTTILTVAAKRLRR